MFSLQAHTHETVVTCIASLSLAEVLAECLRTGAYNHCDQCPNTSTRWLLESVQLSSANLGRTVAQAKSAKVSQDQACAAQAAAAAVSSAAVQAASQAIASAYGNSCDSGSTAFASASGSSTSTDTSSGK